jgi:cytochrome P450
MEKRCPALDITGSDIHGEAARLRAQGPAAQVKLPGGVLAWSVNSYAVAKQLLASPDVTKSARHHWPAFINGEIPPTWEMISWVEMDNISTTHGQAHHRLRRLIGKAFTPRRTEAIRPHVAELTTMLLDNLAEDAAAGATVDLKERFCYPLPGMVVADLIGMGEEPRLALTKVMDMMARTDVTSEQAQEILLGWRGAIADHIALKRADPGEDITSDLIAARDEDGSRLTEQELADTIFAVIGAGSETTINFLDNAITLLLSHPEQLERVKNGQSSWSDVIDEVLRVESPLASLPLRYAVNDIELDGVTIPQGDPIIINYAAPGRDPAVHGESACEFDITREDKDHFSFGHGPHYCLGTGIARMVSTVGLSSLFERYPDVSLAAPVESLDHIPSFVMNGHSSLPVRLTAVASKAA